VCAAGALCMQSDAQSMMLQMLKCTTGILDEHNITYFIDTGTLLGAIRHGGFLSPNDREDVDLAILATDTARLYAIRHLPYERCGFPMIHRSDRQYIPNVVPVRIKNAAFRVFYNYWVIYYYLDIRDYEMIDGKLVDAEFIATSDTATLDPVRCCVGDCGGGATAAPPPSSGVCGGAAASPRTPSSSSCCYAVARGGSGGWSSRWS
jgi:hypothetical protein